MVPSCEVQAAVVRTGMAVYSCTGNVASRSLMEKLRVSNLDWGVSVQFH